MTSKSREALHEVLEELSGDIKRYRSRLDERISFRSKVLTDIENYKIEISGMKQDLEALDLCPDSQELIGRRIRTTESELTGWQDSLDRCEDSINNSKNELQQAVNRHARITKDLNTQ